MAFREALLLSCAFLALHAASQGVNKTRPVSYRLRIHQLREPAVSAEEQQALRYLTEHMSEVTGSTPELLQLRAQPLRPLIPGPDLNRPVVQEPQVEVKYEQRVPTPAHSVVARCGEAEVAIEVKQDFFGNGELIRPSDLTLGGCAAVHADADDHVLYFRSELHGCSSTTKLTEDTFIYTFSLIYAPTPVGSTVVFKTSPAEVTVECRYQRRHYVSSGAVTPTWTTFATAAFADQQLRFDLRLMTDDWRSPRPSAAVTLSDTLHVEASVVRGHHIPLRVYVDTCVASVNPDPHSHPQYTFLTNHGCLRDSEVTGAASYFLQRRQEDKLQFQLKAFRFHQDDSNLLYITCHLKAARPSAPIDWQHKACSYLREAGRWVASQGDNEVCRCCDSSCSPQRGRRSLAADAGVLWEDPDLGSVLPSEPVSKQPPEAAAPPELTPAAQAALCGAAAVMAALLLLLCVGAVTYR